MIKHIVAYSLLLYAVSAFSSEYRGPHSPQRRYNSPLGIRFATKIKTHGSPEKRILSDAFQKPEIRYVEELPVQGLSCPECCVKSCLTCCLIVGLPWCLAAQQSAGSVTPATRSMGE